MNNGCSYNQSVEIEKYKWQRNDVFATGNEEEFKKISDSSYNIALYLDDDNNCEVRLQSPTWANKFKTLSQTKTNNSSTQKKDTAQNIEPSEPKPRPPQVNNPETVTIKDTAPTPQEIGIDQPNPPTPQPPSSAPIPPLVQAPKVPLTDDEMLCGDKPKTMDDVSKSLEEGQFLSKLMPPVNSQNPASWCYAFAALPMVEHHLLLDIMKQQGIDKLSQNEQIAFAQDFYTNPANRISPFEGVYSNNLQRSIPSPQSVSEYTPPRADLLDMNEGGQIHSVLSGIQLRSYQIRSQQQVWFTSVDDKDQRAQKTISSLVARYGKSKAPRSENGSAQLVMGCYVSIEDLSHEGFRDQLRSFNAINEHLGSLVIANDMAPSKHIITNYPALSKHLNENQSPDIQIPPFTNSTIETDDKALYLTSMRNQLQNKRPIGISLCAFDEEFGSKASSNDDRSKDACGAHAVTVTGAYYKNGKCMVNIRNSWGVDWPTPGAGGMKEVTVENYLKLQESYSQKKKTGHSGRSAKYGAEWVDEPINKSGAASYARFITKEGFFEGIGSKKFGGMKDPKKPNSPISQAFWHDYQSGRFTSHDGKEVQEYSNGVVQKLRKDGKWLTRRDDGLYYED